MNVFENIWISVWFDRRFFPESLCEQKEEQTAKHPAQRIEQQIVNVSRTADEILGGLNCQRKQGQGTRCLPEAPHVSKSQRQGKAQRDKHHDIGDCLGQLLWSGHLPGFLKSPERNQIQ